MANKFQIQCEPHVCAFCGTHRFLMPDSEFCDPCFRAIELLAQYKSERKDIEIEFVKIVRRNTMLGRAITQIDILCNPPMGWDK